MQQKSFKRFKPFDLDDQDGYEVVKALVRKKEEKLYELILTLFFFLPHPEHPNHGIPFFGEVDGIYTRTAERAVEIGSKYTDNIVLSQEHDTILPS